MRRLRARVPSWWIGLVLVPWSPVGGWPVQPGDERMGLEERRGAHHLDELGCYVRPDAFGLRVVWVEPRSTGERLRLRRGDILAALNGTPLRQPLEFETLLFRGDSGRTCTLTVRRQGETLQATIRPIKRVLVAAPLGGGPVDDDPWHWAWEQTQPGHRPPWLWPGAPTEYCRELGCSVTWESSGIRFPSVPPGCTAALLGFRSGDLLVRVNDRPPGDLAQFMRALRGPERATYRIEARRGTTILVGAYQVIQGLPYPRDPLGPPPSPTAGMIGALGCQVQATPQGVVVLGVVPGQNAAALGLLPGDVVLAINRQRATTVEEFNLALASGRGRQRFFIDVARGPRLMRGSLRFAGEVLEVREPLRLED